MKRMIAVIAAAVLTIGIGSTSAIASEQSRGRNYVDADSNGVCDYAGTAAAFIDEDGDDICDNRDEDGCGREGRGNNCGQGAGARGCGRAAGAEMRRGRGCGRGMRGTR